jgi:hypothetical protein
MVLAADSALPQKAAVLFGALGELERMQTCGACSWLAIGGGF